MSQLTHTQDPAEAIEGMEADNSAVKERISGLAIEVIPFGRFVTADDGQDSPVSVVLPSTTGEITDGHGMGIAVADVSHQEGPTLGVNQYAINDAVSILRRGRIHVIVEDAVTAIGTPAFVRFSADTFPDLGAFRTDVDTASAVALPGARFMTLAGAGELCVLEFFPTV
ncbi:hypothetical protein LCGC14_0375370 [marine sediment metagenome]|uniref:Uncharacterized protein n=1 Tax=marine sediment metagenome TaxID=412755 RepID=A0A0F9T420_9ZZZZ